MNIPVMADLEDLDIAFLPMNLPPKHNTSPSVVERYRHPAAADMPSNTGVLGRGTWAN